VPHLRITPSATLSSQKEPPFSLDPQQAKPAHTDFDLCRHTAARTLVCRLNGLSM